MLGGSVSVVRDLWLAPSFRQSVASLLQLPASQLEFLATSDQLEPLPGTVDYQTAQALRALYEVAREFGVSQVVDDVEELTQRDFPDVAEDRFKYLQPLLKRRPAFDRRLAFARERSFAFPQVDQFAVALNYRVVVVDTEGESERPELVPIFTLRLTFDEPVLGSDAVVVAISGQDLADVRTQIDNVFRQYEATAQSLRGGLLSEEAEIDMPETVSRASDEVQS